MLVVILFALLWIFLKDKDAAQAVKSLPTHALIQDDGSFRSPSNKYVLNIHHDGTIVMYDVHTADAGVPLFSDNAGSDCMRWYMMWDAKDRLWVYSGDIGTWVVTISQAGQCEKTLLVDYKDLQHEMPQAFWDHLSESVRKCFSPPSSRPSRSPS